MPIFHAKLAADIQRWLVKKGAPATAIPPKPTPAPAPAPAAAGGLPKIPAGGAPLNPQMTAALGQARTRMQSMPAYNSSPQGYQNMRTGLGMAAGSNTTNQPLRAAATGIARRLPRLESTADAILNRGVPPAQAASRYGVQLSSAPPAPSPAAQNWMNSPQQQAAAAPAPAPAPGTGPKTQ